MKLSISRILETSRALATEPGKELSDFISYVAQLSEQVIRALNGRLTFADNFNAKVATYELTTGVEAVISTDGKTPIGIFPIRTVTSLYGVDSFLWYIDGMSNVKVKATFTGSPTSAVQTSLVILFE